MIEEHEALLTRLEDVREVWSESKGCLTKKRRNPDGPAAAKVIRALYARQQAAPGRERGE